MTKIVPATSAHVKALYEPAPGPSVRAFAALDGEEVIGVGGTYSSNGNVVAFLNATDKLRERPVSLMKLARRMETLREGAVYATCDPAIEAAKRFLEHLGFSKIGGDLWHRQ